MRFRDKLKQLKGKIPESFSLDLDDLEVQKAIVEAQAINGPNSYSRFKKVLGR